MNNVNIILEMVKVSHPQATYRVQSNYWAESNEIIFSVGDHHSVIFENELKIAPDGKESFFSDHVIDSISELEKAE
jgi:hypothetical protein